MQRTIIRYYQEQAEAHGPGAKNTDMNPIIDELPKIYEEMMADCKIRKLKHLPQ